MGQSRKRIGGDGEARYTAYYDDVTGRRRSAAAFGTRIGQWQRADAETVKGRHTDSGRSRPDRSLEYSGCLVWSETLANSDQRLFERQWILTKRQLGPRRHQVILDQSGICSAIRDSTRSTEASASTAGGGHPRRRTNATSSPGACARQYGRHEMRRHA